MERLLKALSIHGIPTIWWVFAANQWEVSFTTFDHSEYSEDLNTALSNMLLWCNEQERE